MLAVLALTTLVAAFIQGSTGIGFALILAPVLALLAPDLLPVCLLALMVPLNIYVAWRERGALDRRGAAWITAGRFLGMFGGLWLLEVVTTSRLHLLVGVVIVLAAVLTLLMPVFEPGPRAFVGVGVATGISETATGVGGPPLALVYQHQPPATLRSTLALCFLLGQLMSLAALALWGRATAAQLMVALMLVPALVVGALLSHIVHGRIGGRALRTFVLVFALASGVLLLVRA